MMTLSQYVLLATSGVGLILLAFFNLIVGTHAIAVTLFAGGSLLTVGAVVGALWFSGPWKKRKVSRGEKQRY